MADSDSIARNYSHQCDNISTNKSPKRKIEFPTSLMKRKKGSFRQKISKIPVCIVEDHNDVVPCICRLIGSGRVPLEKMTLVHFDSHSDLTVPQDLDADTALCKEELFSSLSIENWIIPMIYGGHINRVVWVKPFWSQPSLRSHSKFFVGKHLKTGKIRVSSPDNYFLSELSYAPEDELTERQACELHVVTVGDRSICDCEVHSDVTADDDGANSKTSSQLSETRLMADLGDFPCDTNRDVSFLLNQLLVSNNASLCREFILDIDLDFFSTMDPFRSTLTERQRYLMSELYRYTPPTSTTTESIWKCFEDRHEQISNLKTVFIAAQTGQLGQLGDTPRDRLLDELLRSIIPDPTSCSSKSEVMAGNDDIDLGKIPLDPQFDYEWLHEIGTGIDDCPLPHHVSSRTEIARLIALVETLLRSLPKPSAVTIARSSNDDYCPADEVDFIQKSIVAVLESLYSSELDIQLKYDVTNNEQT